MTCNLPRGPRRFDEIELLRVGVEVVDTDPIILACLQCGSQKLPDCPPYGKRLHRGYWKCENGCNDPKGTKC